MTRSEKAMSLFKQGYSCSQSLVGAFGDILPIDTETAIKAAAPFGGGVGRMREICGAVSGMLLVLGMLEGPSDPSNPKAKGDCYSTVQQLAEEFKKENGSIICRELMGLRVKKDSPTPDARTEEYYKSRPCVELVGCAAKILEKYLSEKQ